MTVVDADHRLDAPSGSDPRLSPEPSSERDVRPVVERPRSGLSGAAIASLAVVAGLGLFGVLEARRQGATAPATTPVHDGMSGSAAPPPLYIPPVAPAYVPPPLPVAVPMLRSPSSTPVPAAAYAPATVVASAPSPSPSGYVSPTTSYPAASTPVRRPPRTVSGQALIADTSTQAGNAATDTPSDADTKSGETKRIGLSTNRARAAMLANRSTTVPQGTLIPAVLETAFDSTSPGFARALVQKNIYGFDGTQILIPRGSRLIGEYAADTARGQQRAVILWSRLIRPDGVTIAIGSPAADTLGRGGVKADVNSHFLERFSGAILQSALDIGVNFAARNSRSPVIVALPSSGSAVTTAATARTTDVTPTLRVPAGRSVSVFVARDLDFTAAGAVR